MEDNKCEYINGVCVHCGKPVQLELDLLRAELEAANKYKGEMIGVVSLYDEAQEKLSNLRAELESIEEERQVAYKLLEKRTAQLSDSNKENEKLRAELEAIKKKAGFISRRLEAEEDHANWLEEQNKQLRSELEAKDKKLSTIIKEVTETINSGRPIKLSDATRRLHEKFVELLNKAGG